MRNPGTTHSGGPFSDSVRVAVWSKGQPIPNNESSIWRADRCGAPMRWSDYGMTQSKYGWEIDHNMPVARGGTDELANLQPLQWQNNRHKSDNPPNNWSCAIRG